MVLAFLCAHPWKHFLGLLHWWVLRFLSSLLVESCCVNIGSCSLFSSCFLSSSLIHPLLFPPILPCPCFIPALPVSLHLQKIHSSFIFSTLFSDRMGLAATNYSFLWEAHSGPALTWLWGVRMYILPAAPSPLWSARPSPTSRFRLLYNERIQLKLCASLLFPCSWWILSHVAVSNCCVCRSGSRKVNSLFLVLWFHSNMAAEMQRLKGTLEFWSCAPLETHSSLCFPLPP